MELNFLSRTESIIGKQGIKILKDRTVAIFGVGGVGSFTIEALARTGLGKLILIDNDNICITNINRQIHATHSTIGRTKVEAMKKRILDINPEIEVITYKQSYNVNNWQDLLKADYDYVVDAIDSITSKIHLIEKCKEINIPIVSSMSAGNKIDPTQFVIDDIYNTSVCPIAKILRKELRKRGIMELKVVYSKEKSKYVRKSENNHVPGSIAFVPSVVGLILASVVVRDLIDLNIANECQA